MHVYILVTNYISSTASYISSQSSRQLQIKLDWRKWITFRWEVIGNSRKRWENQKKCQSIRSGKWSGKDRLGMGTLYWKTLGGAGHFGPFDIQPRPLQPGSLIICSDLGARTSILSDSSTLFFSFFFPFS